MRAFAALASLAAAIAAASLFLAAAVPTGDPRAVREWVLSFGPLAPAAFVSLQALQVVVAPIPGQVLAFAAGYLFGSTWGTVFSVAGATLGSLVVFVLARRLGRPFVEDVVDTDVLDEFDRVVETDGRLALFLVFLLPGLPDDAICLAAGITRIPIPQLVVVSVLGRLPGYFVIAYAGSEAANAQFAHTAAVLVSLVMLSGVVYWRRDQVLAWLR